MGGRGRWISEFKASLVYRVSSRTARTAQRNLVSKNQKKKKPEKNNLNDFYSINLKHILTREEKGKKERGREIQN